MNAKDASPKPHQIGQQRFSFQTKALRNLSSAYMTAVLTSHSYPYSPPNRQFDWTGLTQRSSRSPLGLGDGGQCDVTAENYSTADFTDLLG
jgi:hypothetical protein